MYLYNVSFELIKIIDSVNYNSIVTSLDPEEWYNCLARDHTYLNNTIQWVFPNGMLLPLY